MKDYRKILEGIVNIINTTEKSDIGFANICTYIGENCPEIHESEDERIRKEMIFYFQEEIPLCSIQEHADKMKEFVAWLEKQDEKPTLPKWKYKKDHAPLLRDSIILNKYGCVAKSPSGALVSDVWVLDYDELAKLPKEELEKQGKNNIGISEATKQKLEDNLNKALEKETPESCNEFLDKQGEQILDNSAKTCNDDQNPKHFELKAGHWYICHRAFCCRADHLTIKEGERFMCEKDGIVKGFVIKDPEKYFKEVCAPAPMEDEQKPAEWSEEDEHWRQKAIDFMKHPDLIKATPTLAKDTIDWLKPLKDRYTWKPSDEQMEALESATENCAYSEYQDCLRELIAQLKKLREE